MIRIKDISDFEPEAVVVDAGQFPTAGEPLKVLDSGVRVVCCDGAAERYFASGRHPWRIVGDCDSIPPQLRKANADIVRVFPDQETNDQTKAVEYLARKGVRRIAIVGATGLREDHTLGNISLLLDYMCSGLTVRIFTDYGVFIPFSGDCSVGCHPGTQVSIFNFGANGLSAEGLRYPIRDFDSWWQGTLNETLGDHFFIRANGNYLLFLTYPETSGKRSLL